MSQYTQLTQEQRYHIYAFMKAGFFQTAIATEIGVHTSTVSREMRRNQGKKGYRPKQAHAMALERRTRAHKFVKLTPPVIARINEYIRQDFSPEQISGVLARMHHLRISQRLSISIFSTIRPKEVRSIAICASPTKNAENATVPMIVEDRYKAVSVSMSDRPSWIPEGG